MALLAGGPATAIAQTSVADAPWSGEAACVMVTRGPDYAEQQGHRWRLTGERPVVKGSVRFWPAVWSVQGGGSKGEDHWTINVPETPAPIAMYETPGPGGNNGLRIESQHAQLTARQAIRLAVRPAVTRSQYEFTLWELAFPRIIVGSAAQVTVVSDSITRAGAATYAWQAPSGAQSTETCTFRFERGSAPQSTQLAATVTPIAQPTLSAAGVSKPQIQQVETTTTASTPASIARVETGTIPTLSRTAPASSTPTTSPGSNTNPPPPPPPVAPAADVTVTTTTAPGEPWAEIDHNKWITGGTMWLTVSVSNAGPASADGTIVTVPPAVGFLKQSVGCSLGACPTAAELEAGWMIGWLPSGATVRFFIEHRLSVTSGQVTLLATATLPAGTKVLSSAIGEGRLVLTVEVNGAIELLSFELNTLRPLGRVRLGQ